MDPQVIYLPIILSTSQSTSSASDSVPRGLNNPCEFNFEFMYSLSWSFMSCSKIISFRVLLLCYWMPYLSYFEYFIFRNISFKFSSTFRMNILGTLLFHLSHT